MKTVKITFASAGFNLIGEINFPNTFIGQLPAVILFHGLTNSRRDCPLINKTAEVLTNNNFLVFRFDFYGSGESPGEMKDKTIEILEKNARDAIKFISQNPAVDSKRMGIWGRSLGGTIVCLLPPDQKIKARVVASPAVMLEEEMKNKFNQLVRKEIELERLGKKLPGTGNYKGQYELNPDWFRSLKGLDGKIKRNFKNLNTVLILGTALDQKVTVDNACVVVNSVKEPKRIWIYEADHDYKGFEKEAVQESVDWFKRYLITFV